MKTVFTLLASLMVLGCITQTQDITGKWYGKVEVANLRMMFDITKTGNGYTGTLTSLDQSSEAFPIDDVSLKGDSIVLKADKVGILFSGIFKENNRIEGTFLSNGISFTLNLSRNEILVEQSKRPQEPIAPYPYTVDSSINKKANIKLAGTLTKPSTSGVFPAVVLVTGSGPQNRDEELFEHKPFLVIADYLTRNGIAVLRYDDRGVAKSEGIYITASIDDFADDARAAIEYLKTRSDIDKNKIGVLGHSEGGAIALIVAATNDASFIISAAGMGINGREASAIQNTDKLKAAGMDDAYIESYNQVMRKVEDLVISITDKLELEIELTKLLTGTVLDGQVKQIVELPLAEQRSILMFTPNDYYVKIKCPVLALNGEKDILVPAKLHLDAIYKGITTNGNKNVTIKSYPDLNHLFQKTSSQLNNYEYGEIEETFNEQVLKDITEWILKQ